MKRRGAIAQTIYTLGTADPKAYPKETPAKVCMMHINRYVNGYLADVLISPIIQYWIKPDITGTKIVGNSSGTDFPTQYEPVPYNLEFTSFKNTVLSSAKVRSTGFKALIKKLVVLKNNAPMKF